MQERRGLIKQITANPYFPRKTMMSVEMLELIKGLLCVGKCNNTELDIILFGDIRIFSPKIQLGPIWQQSTTKMAVVFEM